MPMADLKLKIEENSIDNRKSEIGNILETPKSGQGAKCPDRFLAKSGYFLSSNLLGVTPAPQYSLNLTT